MSFESWLGDGPIEMLVAASTVLVAAVGLYLLLRRVVLPLVARAVHATHTQWDDLLSDRKVQRWLALLFPTLFMMVAGSAVPLSDFWSEVWLKATAVAAIVFGAMGLGAALNAFNTIYERLPVSRELPIKGYVQVLALVLYLFGDIWVLSVITGQSPWFFLSGLGAAAVVLLVFYRDSILNFVASAQLTQNDMLRVGDWIEMPQFGADGTVVDVALATVKVQNWDNSITTIPTHRLISESFRNWRGMWEKGTRRIKRSINIDVRSIRFLTDDEANQSSRQAVPGDGASPAGPVDVLMATGSSGASRRTNLDAFSSCIVAQLRARADIASDGMPLLVRQLSPGAYGLPLEIYAFSTETRWEDLETIQGDIVGRALAILPHFGLRPYQVVSDSAASSELHMADLGNP